jgi:putative transposase
MLFHVLNRGVGKMRLFFKDGDYLAFERTILKTLESCPMRILAYTLMPNHWHFVLWPEHDGDLAAFMQKLTISHARNWQVHRQQVGFGHLYQGRYKSFPVQRDDHFYQVMRYVERNPLRARLVEKCETWRWCSLWRRSQPADDGVPLCEWPLARPRDWVRHVQRAQTEAELAVIRRSVQRGQPFGDDRWVSTTAEQLGLESTIRPRGRPRKASVAG